MNLQRRGLHIAGVCPRCMRGGTSLLIAHMQVLVGEELVYGGILNHGCQHVHVLKTCCSSSYTIWMTLNVAVSLWSYGVCGMAENEELWEQKHSMPTQVVVWAEAFLHEWSTINKHSSMATQHRDVPPPTANQRMKPPFGLLKLNVDRCFLWCAGVAARWALCRPIWLLGISCGPFWRERL